MKEELEKKCYIDKVYSFENFITNESNVEIAYIGATGQ